MKTHFAILVTIFGTWFSTGLVQAQSEPCFSNHLYEAIALNSQRYDDYARLTDGRSKTISRGLMASEAAGIPLARALEVQASFFQERGIPVLCKDFVSMTLVPIFRNSYDGPAPQVTDFVTVSSRELVVSLHKAWSRKSYQGLRLEAEGWIRKLRSKKTNCLTRHVLESIVRVSRLAPEYMAMAKNKHLFFSPGPISDQAIYSHFTSIPIAVDLDRRALPIQLSGVPILCQDVPPIQ